MQNHFEGKANLTNKSKYLMQKLNTYQVTVQVWALAKIIVLCY